ncbi:MAG: ABC transporter ATP-binding protein [Bacillota bacterium]
MFKLKNVKFRDILYIEDLTIEGKETTCIVGTSGGGKTTFLKLLNNMIDYQQGSILYKNKEIREYDPIKLRREIPMLPQNPVLFEGTIRDNFLKTLEYAEIKVAKSDSNFQRLLKMVNMDDHRLNRKIDNLSGGEKQRIALARVLLLKPVNLLLDEPSSALDEKTEEKIIEMVTDYIERIQGTLVMVTHSREIAKKYGDKIVTINQGEIENITRNKEKEIKI